MSTVEPIVRKIPAPSAAELRQAYQVGVRSRALEEHIVRLASRGELKFAIWGPGEEIHGTATALALSKVVDPKHFGMVPHYRSGCLCSMWCELNGKHDFTLSILRQQFSKDTDPMTRGRQMVYHVEMTDGGDPPRAEPRRHAARKGRGYAKGFSAKGITDGVALAIVGDGTTAEGDMHDAMNAASVWHLPLITMVTDNGIAISTRPDEGRGIKDFEAYAKGFGMRHFACDGRDFWDVYNTTYEAARYVRDEQRPCSCTCIHLPRFNGHSSAADMTFDLNQQDPLDRVRRGAREGRHPREGTAAAEEEGRGPRLLRAPRARRRHGRRERDDQSDARSGAEGARPADDSITENIYPPFPEVEEHPAEGTTNITYAGAIRAALAHIVDKKGGVIWGQDIARLGGVMQATAGLQKRFPDRVFDTPLNEPLILGTACGAGLHEGVVALPEVQFGDYALNTFHWLVHMGNLYWTTNGPLEVRDDPAHAGRSVRRRRRVPLDEPRRVHHADPGARRDHAVDELGHLRALLTAATTAAPSCASSRSGCTDRRSVPRSPASRRMRTGSRRSRKRSCAATSPRSRPTARAVRQGGVRRPGKDITIVSWGRAAWTSLRAAEALANDGIDAEVIDLRTLVPPDLEAVYESVGRTGRLVVAAEDRSFAGFVRSIQGHAVEKFPGLPSKAIGQKNIPGIAQSLLLEEATVLTDEDVVHAVHEVLEIKGGGGGGGWSWIPPRYFLA
jgi:2-oxoisovalerate dehydrogenase E1 component